MSGDDPTAASESSEPAADPPADDGTKDKKDKKDKEEKVDGDDKNKGKGNG